MGCIIIIDDQVELLELLQEQLENWGHTVKSFSDASQVLQFIQNENVDIILSDLKMPGLSGLELYSQVHKVNLMIPFIIFTAYGNQEKVVNTFELGVFAFIDKPIDPVILETTINNALKHVEKVKKVSNQ